MAGGRSLRSTLPKEGPMPGPAPCAPIGLLCFAPLPPPAGEAPTDELALVPADALAVFHVRLAAIWKSDAFQEWRDTILRAGRPALSAFDQRFFPTPSTLDTLTAYVLPPSGAGM